MYGVGIFLPSNAWPIAKSEITSLLSQDPDLAVYLKGGSVLPIGSEVSEIEFGPHEQQSGRRLKQYSQNVNSAKQLLLLEEAFSTAYFTPHVPTAHEVILGPNDCLSVAPISLELMDQLLNYIKRKGIVYQVAIQWDTRNLLHKRFFWDILITTNFVASGIIFDQFEDGPTEFATKDDEIRFVPDKSYGVPPNRNWFFSAPYSEILLEYDAPSVHIPEELTTGSISIWASNLIQKSSPAERIISTLISGRTKRISPIDDPRENASAHIAPPGRRFPDLRKVENKLFNYSLSNDHEKLIGFLQFGFGFAPRADSLTLAGDFCSALIEDFLIVDPRVNADGSIQFTAPVAMISPYGNVLRMNTSWVLSESDAPHLSTAFVVGRDAYPEWSTPPPLTESAPESNNLSILATFKSALDFASGFVTDLPLAKWTITDHDQTGDIADSLGIAILSHDYSANMRLKVNAESEHEFEVFGEPSSTEAFLRYAQYALARHSIRIELKLNT